MMSICIRLRLLPGGMAILPVMSDGGNQNTHIRVLSHLWENSAKKAEFCRVLQSFADFSDLAKSLNTLPANRLAKSAKEKVC